MACCSSYSSNSDCQCPFEGLCLKRQWVFGIIRKSSFSQYEPRQTALPIMGGALVCRGCAPPPSGTQRLRDASGSWCGYRYLSRGFCHLRPGPAARFDDIGTAMVRIVERRGRACIIGAGITVRSPPCLSQSANTTADATHSPCPLFRCRGPQTAGSVSDVD